LQDNQKLLTVYSKNNNVVFELEVTKCYVSAAHVISCHITQEPSWLFFHLCFLWMCITDGSSMLFVDDTLIWLLQHQQLPTRPT